jgi:DNA-binding NarL/FixJ family response regulator
MGVRVFLVEDSDIVRLGIKTLLNTADGTEVIGEARNGKDALKQLKVLRPQVLLMDMGAESKDCLDCTRKIRKEYPLLKVLILATEDDENQHLGILEAGANGYILKSTSKEELVFAVKKIARDGIYMGTELTLDLLAKYKAAIGFIKSKPKLNIKISDREMDVLKLIGEGLTNAEMAKKLFTSVRTIETRRKKLLEKTGTTNTATLIRFAVLNALIK